MERIRSKSLLYIGIGTVLIVGITTGVGGVISNERPPTGQAPPINDSVGEKVITQTQSQNEAASIYVVTARTAGAIDTVQLEEYGEVGTQADARIELTTEQSNVSAVRNISWVKSVRPVMRSEPAQTGALRSHNEERGSLGVQQAHESGITGKDVEIGIIDTGFAPNNPAIASNVAEVQSFRNTPGYPAHGTAVAEVIIRTAPDSQLYLASSGSGTDTEAAISYLRRQDVDIIVHSAGIPVIEDDGNHFLTDDINAARADGTLFVNSAGNYAQTHWEGDFRDADMDGAHEWTGGGDELNCIPNCQELYSGTVAVYVRWNDQGRTSHYRPALFNSVTNNFIAIDNDRTFTTPSGTKYAALVVEDIPAQAVSLAIENVRGPGNDEIEVVVTSGPQRIQRNIRASSLVAPGDVPAAMTVAAYERERGQIAPYSSRGPTDAGQTGVDVTGYTNIQLTNEFYPIFSGTSAAAPHAGGVAALIEDSQPGDQSPAELANSLKSSSDDILTTGTDTASGSGVVNAAAAVENKAGVLTGQIRAKDNSIIEEADVQILLERRTANGDFKQIREQKEVSDGQYSFKNLTTGNEYRVRATFQGETGSTTISNLEPGINTNDIIIPGADLSKEAPVSVTQTISSKEAAPSSEITHSIIATGVSGPVSINSSYSPELSSATLRSVTVNDTPANPIVAEAAGGGSVVVLNITGENSTVIITETLTVGNETNTTHTISGGVTVEGTTKTFDPVLVTVSDPKSVIDKYDTDNDGVEIAELGRASKDFADNDLTIAELGQIAAAYSS